MISTNQPKLILLDLEVYKRKKVVFIRFAYDKDLIKAIRTIEHARWNPDKKVWELPWSDSLIDEIDKAFSTVAEIDDALLTEKLRRYQQTKAHSEYSGQLSAATIQKMENYKRWLYSRRYSENTIQTYSDALKKFLMYYHSKSISEINNDDIINFNNDYILKNRLSGTYQNQFVSTLKLFFREIEQTSIEIDLIHRPKRAKVLPNVLSKEEVKLLLEATQNVKHKAMLSLIYACGLRCGEILKLLPEHVDSKRGLLIIKDAKGMKDRIAPLSKKIIELLRIYYKAFKPTVYLFEGAKQGNAYDERSLQNVMKQNVRRAGIKKPVTLHWLRHSYATHLLENGTDLRYIQEILGHKSSRTTEIYTHVSKKSIQNITSPFDDL